MTDSAPKRVAFQVRLEPRIHTLLKELAGREHRSLMNMVEALILREADRQGLDQTKKPETMIS